MINDGLDATFTTQPPVLHQGIPLAHIQYESRVDYSISTNVCVHICKCHFVYIFVRPQPQIAVAFISVLAEVDFHTARLTAAVHPISQGLRRQWGEKTRWPHLFLTQRLYNSLPTAQSFKWYNSCAMSKGSPVKQCNGPLLYHEQKVNTAGGINVLMTL